MGVGVALLEEDCDWGWALGFQKLKSGPALTAACDSSCKISAPSPVPRQPARLLACFHASCRDDNVVNL